MESPFCFYLKTKTYMKRIIITAIAAILTLGTVDAKPKQLKAWQEGYMDIHHISTGRGSAIFFMLPDGTRLLADAGDLGDPSRWKHKEIMPAVPSADKRPAEWIARYIEHFSKPLNRELYLDYAMITHFDTDHYGIMDHTAITVAGKPYKYTGMTHLANLVPVRTMIDRGYPAYDYPTPERFRKRNGKLFKNYELFIKEREGLGLKNEQFRVGSDKQFVLKTAAEKYPSFRIMNIAANGKIWIGNGESTRNLVPASAPEGAALNENSSSCVFRLEYGNFSYYLGGDISGTWSRKKKNPWNDVQSQVAKVIGTVDVAVADHHGYRDSVNENLLKALNTNVLVIPIWDLYHPHPNAMKRVVEQGVPEIFPAGITEARLAEMKEKGLGDNIRKDGHIVVRVYKGGKKYQVFVLNDRSLDYEVIYKSRTFKSRGNK